MRRARKRVKGANAPKLRRSRLSAAKLWRGCSRERTDSLREASIYGGRGSRRAAARPRRCASAHRAVRRSRPRCVAARSPSTSRPIRTRPAPRPRRSRAGPAGQASIAASKPMPQARHKRAQHPFGIGEHVLALDDGRGAAEAIGGAGEHIDLCGQADLVQREASGACAHRTRAPLRAARIRKALTQASIQSRPKPASMWCVMCF